MIPVKKLSHFIIIALFVFSMHGCSARTYSYREPFYERHVEGHELLAEFSLPAEVEDEILALDPERITGEDIAGTLSRASAPRILNIHGGIYPVYLIMESFSKFLIFMGYPEEKIRNPRDGSYSLSCYEKSTNIAGQIAWYYEKEGMRPILVGHSQGGIQVVKVLHQLSGTFNRNIPVWNPLTEKAEDRNFIIDPLTGSETPVVGLRLAYATAVGAGGITRFLPNQWSMLGRLRGIPDSVEEFAGFYMGMDVFGGDLLGFGPLNHFRANGTAFVRNIKLPFSYSHVMVPVTRHLAKNEETRNWINSYTPSEEPGQAAGVSSPGINILWAADVWHSIKKHWVLELQRLIRAKRDRIK